MGPLHLQAGLLSMQDGWEGCLMLRMAREKMTLILLTLSHQADITARVCTKSLQSCLTLLKELKDQHSENEDHGIWSHHFMQIDGKTVETARLYFFGLQNHCRW